MSLLVPVVKAVESIRPFWNHHDRQSGNRPFHPPFGINIFVAQSVLGIKLEPIYRGIIPFCSSSLRSRSYHNIPDITLWGVRLLFDTDEIAYLKLAKEKRYA